MKRRILYLVKGLNRGGTEQLLLSRLPYLDTSRFSYEVAYLLSWADSIAQLLQDAGFPVHCLQADQRPGWLPRLRNLVRRREIDLIAIHSPYAAIGARLMFPRHRDPPIVCTEHTVWEGYHRVTYWVNAVTFPRNDHVFAVSDHVRESIRYPAALRRLHMPPVERLYEGIDPAAIRKAANTDGVRDELRIPDGAMVVGCVANFTPQKAHQYLLQAIDRVRRRLPNVKLVLVGDGPLEAEVRRRVDQLDLSSVVIFAGGRTDVPRVASTFDLFVLSSVQEGLSIALLEAMALGKPVVVTEAGGLPEVVEHGKHGLVVPIADADALAEAIGVLLSEEASRLKMGREAQRRTEDFHIARSVRRVEEVYGELLGC